MAQKTCYWPDGTSAAATDDDYVPCYSDRTDSHCCLRGEACLGNNLCFGAYLGLVYRGACTDPTWETSACPTYCHNLFPKWSNLYPCTPASNTSWCGTGDVCSTVDGSTFTYPVKGSVYSLAGSESFSSLNASSTAGNETSNHTTTIPPEAATVTATAATSFGLSKNVPIGIGVGVGIPLALACAVFAALWFRERRVKKRAGVWNKTGRPTSSTAHTYTLQPPGDQDIRLHGNSGSARPHDLFEAPWQTRPTEMSGEGPIAEL